MKILGVKQVQQKRYKLLDQPECEFKNHLGDIPAHFMMIVFGDSGNGKTEYDIKLAKYFASFGRVLWLSYEQGHGYDLQKAINRNNMEEVSGNFLISDPVADLPRGVSFVEDIDKCLKKRNSPEFIFIDSLDYTGFTWDEYDFLKRKYGNKKTFVFISHSEGKKPLKRIGQQILYDCCIGIYVKNFIATNVKNRFGGDEDYIIYPEKARELNPLYFKVKLKESAAKEPKQVKMKVNKNIDTAPELPLKMVEA